MTVVVVGAGIAGIACAVELASAGVDVRVVDRGARRRWPDGEQADRRPPRRPRSGVLHRARPRVRPGGGPVADGGSGAAVDVGDGRVQGDGGTQPRSRPGPLGCARRPAQPRRRARRGAARRARAQGHAGRPGPDGGRRRRRRRRPRDARPAGPAHPRRHLARDGRARRPGMAAGDLRGRRVGAAGVAADERGVRQRPPGDLARRRRRRPPRRRRTGAGGAHRRRRRAPATTPVPTTPSPRCSRPCAAC